MIDDELSRDISYSAGLTGCKMITGTSAVTGPFQSFIVNEALVVSAITDKNGNSLMSTLGLSTVTLSVGMLITAPKGNYFSTITLTSGSAVGYLV
jgi:hypothetical protein